MLAPAALPATTVTPERVARARNSFGLYTRCRMDAGLDASHRPGM